MSNGLRGLENVCVWKNGQTGSQVSLRTLFINEHISYTNHIKLNFSVLFSYYFLRLLSLALFLVTPSLSFYIDKLLMFEFDVVAFTCTVLHAC